MSDKLLWKQLKDGNHSALESIYRAHVSFLYNYGKKFSNDSNTIKDCIQDLFIELWDKRDRLGDTDAIRAYLLVSLRRKIIKTVNTIQKSTNDNEPGDFIFQTELSIADIIVNKEIDQEKKKQLQKAFERLSSRQREAIYLKYYADMDYQSIAETMEINYQSIRNLVSKGIKELAKGFKFFLMLIFSLI